MPHREILVFRQGEDWCVRCEGALFERMASEGDALRVAKAHARGSEMPVRVRGDRRPAR